MVPDPVVDYIKENPKLYPVSKLNPTMPLINVLTHNGLIMK